MLTKFFFSSFFKNDSARDKVMRSWGDSFVPTATYRQRRRSSGSCDLAGKSPSGNHDDAQEGEATRRRRNASGEGTSEQGEHPPSSPGKKMKKHAKRPRSPDAQEDEETRKSASSSSPVKKPKKRTRSTHRSFSLNEMRREAEMMCGPNLTPQEKTELGLAVVERYKQRRLSETPH